MGAILSILSDGAFKSKIMAEVSTYSPYTDALKLTDDRKMVDNLVALRV
jgi:hypothetical protein